jgi:hypothetical protein
VAIAVEAVRLERSSLSTRGRLAPVIGALAVAGAAVWAWRGHGAWSALDLLGVRWGQGFNAISALATAACFLVAVTILEPRIRARSLPAIEALLPALALVVVSFAVVGITGGVLIANAARAPWSTAGQNLDALTGRSECGLAQQLRGQQDAGARMAERSTRTLVAPELAAFFPCARSPAVHGGVVEIPDLVVSWLAPWPLYGADRPFAAVTDLYSPRAVANGPQAVEVYSVDARIPGFARVDAVGRRA